MSATSERPTVASLLFGYLEQQVDLVYGKEMNASEEDLHQLARLVVVIQGLENTGQLKIAEKRADLFHLAISRLKAYRFSSATIHVWKKHGLKSPWARTFFISTDLDQLCSRRHDSKAKIVGLDCEINDAIRISPILDTL